MNDHNYDPDATYFYELMSGAFLWSDELPKVSSDLGRDFYDDHYVFRFLLAHRHDLTLDEPPRDDFDGNAIWQQVKKHAPNWPGLQEKRYTGRIVKRLKAAKRLSNYQLDKCDTEWDEGE